MRITAYFLIFIGVLCLVFTSNPTSAQAPPIQWASKYGGSSTDIPNVIKITSDGGTVVAGYTTSKDGDVHTRPNREYWDLWVLKLDKCGNIEWEKSVGGTGYESAHDIIQAADGSYYVFGETNSTDGEVIAGYGGTKDIWLLKLDPAGNLQWQKRYGGTGLDIGNKLWLQDDGSLAGVASTSSNDGNISGNHGTMGFTDGVLMRFTPAGDLTWSRCYGGSRNDELLDILVINNRTYVVGYANSVDGDIPPNQKNYDVWLMALDQNGNKIFSRIYGGSQNDVAYAMCTGSGTSITISGYTTSNDGDVNGAKGSQDYWVLNLSLQGTINWQQTMGGSEADYANNVVTDLDGGYLIGGITYSTNGDVVGARGQGDYWLIKLSANGTPAWTQIYGGGLNDQLRSIAVNHVAREYYLAGDAESTNGNFRGSRRGADFGIIKLKQPAIEITDTLVCSISGFATTPDTLHDVCGYDSVILVYQPVPLEGPFSRIPNRDTIFRGESYNMPASTNGDVRWTYHPTLSCTDCVNPVATPEQTTTYTATSELPGCSVSDEYTIVVLEDAIVNIPNAFTPNGDGHNDIFGAFGKVLSQFQMQIYNRYGQLIFLSSSIDQKWDGRVNGRLQDGGIYVYIIKYTDQKNHIQHRKGTVTLIR